MDKIEKIRQEIERRMKIYKESNYGISLRYQELEEILSFLDTLSEEPSESLEEEMDHFIDAHYHTRFDETLENGNDSLTVFDFEDIARHFAKWGAEHLRDSTKMIDKSLDEAAEEYRRESFKKSVMPQIDGPVGEYGGDIKSAFIAGAEWQKGQMLKDAVEGYVNYYEDSGGILMAEAQVGCPYHNGDKVRIVVIREEEE